MTVIRSPIVRLILLTLALPVALVLVLRVVQPAAAANPISITVTTTNDVVAADGFCSLREAVHASNGTTGQAFDCPANPRPTVIVLPAGTYQLTIANTNANENGNLTGDLDFYANIVEVRGAGASETIIQAGSNATNGIDRVIDVQSGTVTFDGVTIRYGKGGDTGRCGGDQCGGGIFVNLQHSLNVRNSIITNNASDFGAAIENQGIATIENSTISGNVATYRGGGIESYNGTLTIRNSTLSGNSAGEAGGAISIDGGGLTTLVNSTLNANTAPPASGGGIDHYFGTLYMTNTIIANSTGGDCRTVPGVFIQTRNLIRNSGINACNLNTTTNVIGVNPLLGALQDNGGPTPTHAIPANSPAVNAGDNAGCLPTDQRGVARPFGGTCDIGAYEYVDCAALPATVTNAGDLNNAITCFNLQTTPGTVTIAVGSDITQTQATPVIDNSTAGVDLVIAGNGHALDGAASWRGLTIAAGSDVSVENWTIRNGAAAGAGDAAHGGGIFNAGTLTLVSSTIRANSAENRGGGIYNSGSLTVNRSTIAANDAYFGGGIFTVGASLAIENSTLSGNTAALAGGGLHNDAGLALLTHVTVVGNSAPFGAGLSSLAGEAAGTLLRATIVSDNTGGGSDVELFAPARGAPFGARLAPDSFTSGGYNRIGTVDAATTAFNGGTDLTGQSGLVEPVLMNNSGATPTHALFGTAAAAIDAVPTAGCPATDQRGVARPQGALCDVGAVEYDGCAVANVANTAELNNAIGRFNAAPAAESCRITFAADIVLDAPTTVISNTAAALLTIDGADRYLDGAQTWRGLTITGTTTVSITTLTIQHGAALDDSVPNGRYGGAIQNYGTLALRHSQILSNTAISGGGIDNRGTLSVATSIIRGNTIPDGNLGGGGGVYSDGHATFDRSVLSYNTATGGGGAIGVIGDGAESSLTIVNSTLHDNQAAIGGGAIATYQMPVMLSNSTLSGNQAPEGAGIHSVLGKYTLTGNTFYGNQANDAAYPNRGGGINAFGGTLILVNNIFVNNTGGDCASQGIAFNPFSVGNLLQSTGTDTCGMSFLNGNYPGLDAKLGPLQDNGGPTPTHLPADDSPALNNAIGCTLADQRGVQRPQGAACDIGAVELIDFATGALAVGTGDYLDAAIREYNQRDVDDVIIYLTANITLRRPLIVFNMTGLANLIINGGGQFGLDGLSQFRLVELSSQLPASASVVLRNVALDNGRSPQVLAVTRRAAAASDENGGAVLVEGGHLVLDGVTVRNSTAVNGGGVYLGGGRLTISNTAFISNTANLGGALNTFSGDGATIVNSTFSGNHAATTGGAILNSVPLTLTNSTLANNSAANLGGGLYNLAAATLRNTLIAGNTAANGADNCDGTAPALLATLIGDGSCGGTLSGDPLLGPLAANGGGTPTHALLPGSPAINAGDNGVCPAFDQRIFGRADGQCDIGAYEAAGVPTAVGGLRSDVAQGQPPLAGVVLLLLGMTLGVGLLGSGAVNREH